MGTITPFPEKHRKVIEAWIAGKDIEVKNIDGAWVTLDSVPYWFNKHEYRTKKNKVKKWRLVEKDTVTGLLKITDEFYSDIMIKRYHDQFTKYTYEKILSTEIEDEE